MKRCLSSWALPCRAGVPLAARAPDAAREKVIIDTDPGIDDMMALFFALAAHKRGEIEVLGLTITHGNHNDLDLLARCVPLRRQCRPYLREWCAANSATHAACVHDPPHPLWPTLLLCFIPWGVGASNPSRVITCLAMRG